MNPATFKLANLHMIVTISPEARRWVNETYVSLETYAWDQARKVLDGGEADKGVSVVPTHEFKTPWDRGYSRHNDSPRIDAPGDTPVGRELPSEHTGKGTSGKTVEWPKWVRTSHVVARHDSETSGEWWGGGLGGPYRMTSTLASKLSAEKYIEITPTEAARWLREHGHEEAAAEIDALPPSLRGARVFSYADQGRNGRFVVVDESGAFSGCGKWHFIERQRRLISSVEQCIANFLTELHGPVREEVLRDFATSEAFREWEAQK